MRVLSGFLQMKVYLWLKQNVEKEEVDRRVYSAPRGAHFHTKIHKNFVL